MRCLKLQVFFCKRASNDRALLRKMTNEDKASYDSTPPCGSPQQMQIHTGRQGFEIEGVDYIKTGATSGEAVSKANSRSPRKIQEATLSCITGRDLGLRTRARAQMIETSHIDCVAVYVAVCVAVCVAACVVHK